MATHRVDVEVVAPQGSPLDRLVVLGVGKAANLKEFDWLKLGGQVAAQFRKSVEVAVVLDLPEAKTASKSAAKIGGAEAASVAAGILLRSYSFDKYKTRKDDADGKAAAKKPSKFVIHCEMQLSQRLPLVTIRHSGKPRASASGDVASFGRPYRIRSSSASFTRG